MPVQVKNNAATTLTSAVSASDTTLFVADGAVFPEPTGSDYFYVTIVSALNTNEIVRVTARTGNQLTVERGAENTNAISFTAGARVELRLTAQTLMDVLSGGSTISALYATLVNTTNLEVTNLKAKDGTIAGSIADVTGVVTLGAVDINSGFIDGVAFGSSTPGAVTATTLIANTSLSLASGSTVTSILDEDNMVSDSDTALATQQSIKAYVDNLTSGVVTLTGLQTLTNKTLTAPAINTADINGGTIDGATINDSAIGGTTPAAGTFTTAEADHYRLGNVTTGASGATLTAGQFFISTAATQTVTLPASPSAGDTVYIGVRDFTDTVVGRNGEPIMSTAEDMTIDVANVTLTFTYVNGTIGWRVY